MHLIPVIDMKTYEYLYSFLNLERVLDNLYSFCGAGAGKGKTRRRGFREVIDTRKEGACDGELREYPMIIRRLRVWLRRHKATRTGAIMGPGGAT